jgi:hypothetical protein
VNRTSRAPATLAGFATLATAIGAVLLTAAPSLASDGTASLASSSGGLSSSPTFVTSGGCKSASATNVQVTLTGGDTGAKLNGANIVGNAPISIYSQNSSGGYNIPAPQSWGDFFTSNKINSPSGVYTVTVVCRTANDGTDVGDFSGTVQWTSGSYSSPATAPTVGSAARITGSVRVGSADTCAVTFTGSSSTTYAWLSNGSTIARASGRTYKVADALYGRTLSCRATGTNGVGSTSSTSSGVRVAAGPALRVVRKPTLSGSHVHGAYEKASAGTWSPAATSYSYQWYVGTRRISRATSYRYLISRAYVGKTISCLVTAHRHGWSNGAVRTAGVKVTR